MENIEQINSKCENCGSQLVYNPKQGCLVCRHCETNFFLPQKNDRAVLVRQYSSKFHPNTLNRSLIALKCNSCGNVYYLSSEMMSKKCPNCGSNSSSIVEDEGFCADGIIPFKITREQASEIFSKHLKKQGNIPSNLKKLAKEQKLMGVYVPVWNFKINLFGFYQANASQVNERRDGSFFTTYRPVYDERHKCISSLDESATSAEDVEFLTLFDENDYSAIIPYSPEYTYGFRVDKINRDLNDVYFDISKKAESEFKSELTRRALNSYKELKDLAVDARCQEVFFNFTYVPVYVNTYLYKGKLYRTYISGTTGKVVGKSPLTFKRILKTLLKIVGVVGLVALIALMISYFK